MACRLWPGLRRAALALLTVALPSAGEQDMPPQVASPRIAILPFADEAGFQGDWDLAVDVPRQFVRHLEEASGLVVIDADSVFRAEREARRAGHRGDALATEVSKRLDADYVLAGRVTDCGVRRVMAGDPNLGGYRSFTYSMAVEDARLTRAGMGVVRTLSVKRDSVIRPLELSLFGRPTTLDKEFEQLFRVSFGSEAFDELPFGQFVRRALDELASDVVSTIYDRRPLVLSRDGAKVLAVDGEQVFLGIGVEDYLEVGDVVPILDGDGERVALVEVRQIIGPHLSSAMPLSTGGDDARIEVGLRLGQRLTPDAVPSTRRAPSTDGAPADSAAASDGLD